MKFSYMGTKRALAPQVGEQIKVGKNGPLLDLFSGVGCIGERVQGSRQIWLNDVQTFANTVAKALFTSRCSLEFDKIRTHFGEHFRNNLNSLDLAWGELISDEQNILIAGEASRLQDFYSALPCVLTNSNLEFDRTLRASYPDIFPFNLFVTCYSGTYLGVQQAAELDSLRYAISMLEREGLIDSEDRNWLLLGLCKAISKTSTITGHFAQFLSINDNNQRYYFNQRKRNLLSEFEMELPSCVPLGEKDWRRQNLVYNTDALSLLKRLVDDNSCPGVIYADPPYTDDQYSRFYHLYETVIKYDYPQIYSKARYRSDRYKSAFSVKTMVHDSISELIALCAQLGSDLIFSYPRNGLLPNAEIKIPDILREYYPDVQTVQFIDHKHSSFGRTSTSPKQNVVELVFYAKA